MAVSPVHLLVLLVVPIVLCGPIVAGIYLAVKLNRR